MGNIVLYGSPLYKIHPGISNNEEETEEVKEKEEKREAPAPESESEAEEQAPLPEVNFATFVFSLSSSAILHFGEIPDPTTGTKKKNLPLAKQTIVCAHYNGDESLFDACEKLAMDMYAPVWKSFRITAEQMGLLEPALVETLCSTLQVIVREGLDEVVKRRSALKDSRWNFRMFDELKCVIAKCNLKMP